MSPSLGTRVVARRTGSRSSDRMRLAKRASAMLLPVADCPWRRTTPLDVPCCVAVSTTFHSDVSNARSMAKPRATPSIRFRNPSRPQWKRRKALQCCARQRLGLDRPGIIDDLRRGLDAQAELRRDVENACRGGHHPRLVGRGRAY